MLPVRSQLRATATMRMTRRLGGVVYAPIVVRSPVTLQRSASVRAINPRRGARTSVRSHGRGSPSPIVQMGQPGMEERTAASNIRACGFSYPTRPEVITSEKNVLIPRPATCRPVRELRSRVSSKCPGAS
jgi:hypothetical protein